MTRKHYVRVAAAIAEQRAAHAPQPDAVQAIDSIARELADLFKADNGRFDRQRFYNACGLDS